MGLTAQRIENAKPRDKHWMLWDGGIPGFGVRIMPSGSRTFYIRYRTQIGTQRWTKLGTWPHQSVARAKAAALEILRAVQQGQDPEMERQRRRVAPDLRELAAKYMDEHGSRKKSGFNDEILWRRHLLPRLGGNQVGSLSHEQVRLFHSSHPRPVTANRAVEVLSKAMVLAEQWGWREPGTNPCEGLKAHPERKRRRYLDEDELLRFRSALEEMESSNGRESVRWRFVQLMRLLLLTGARLGEILEAEWSWIRWNSGVIEVPAHAHKTGGDLEPKEILLTDESLRILRALQEHRTSEVYVIAGARPNRPLSGHRKMWLEIVERARLTDVRIHDLRHTFASYGISEGIGLDLIGQLLGHRSAQTTLRYSHLVRDRVRDAADRIGQSMS